MDQHEAGRWRAEEHADDAPVREPMTGKGMKPADRRKPDSDQKKVRRELIRQAQAEIEADADYDLRVSPSAKSWNIGPKGSDGSGSAGGTSVRSQMSDGGAAASESGSGPSGSGGSSSTALTQAPQVSLSPGAQHADVLSPSTRHVTDDSDFDGYLVTRCADHGTKMTGDRESQEHYIGLAHECHADAHGPHGFQHDRWHSSEGHDCWSCCPAMYIATPGERESGRTAARKEALLPNTEYSGPMKGIEHAGDRECEACGHNGPPVLSDTGPACPSCGSYSLKRSPYASGAHAGVTATRMETNVASPDGRILLNAGDQIRTPTGQALTIKNVRRHETSRDHYYVDTDAGTTLVNYSTNFTLVPNNQSQQFLPGTGVPGGNFNAVPGLENDGSAAAPDACPACGSKGTLNRQGQTFKCMKCGYSDKNVGGGMNFSDATQVIKSSLQPRTAGAIATRAREVLAQEEENPL